MLCKALLSGIPSAKEITECISSKCDKSERNIMYLTYKMGKEGRLDELQTFLDERIETDFINCAQIFCDNMKSVKTIISKNEFIY
ncbi:unnamed protein product [Macrosiphum euphorbiae]|uniref:Uncharacterized protein n=1 Tax=Macrosiphum euphorbiae TaxID=13131 RepID=A0AAV0XV55_9HEMI|nr:unnamed protein product [Macrosiphum euphorbiae]